MEVAWAALPPIQVRAKAKVNGPQPLSPRELHLAGRQGCKLYGATTLCVFRTLSIASLALTTAASSLRPCHLSARLSLADLGRDGLRRVARLLVGG